ncbi:MAG: DJ-1/PfpI family protein [Tannerella sp.]|jgi:4-methyl-5(b-hydroxyethyl)-thiazole monophosphate biosynthesis|nr:DJ-1/PfpI family protein [Tannerella sp.]
MKLKVYVFLATGFEETEAVGTVDVLRRGGVEATMVSVTGRRIVTGAHGIPVEADMLFEDGTYEDAEALVLPGGGPGSGMLNSHEGLKRLLVQHSAQKKWLAAICAAPLVPGGLGLLAGRKATCYPGVESQLTGATLVTGRPVVVDGHLITGRGPGLVFDFALTILACLAEEETAANVANDLLLPPGTHGH